MEICDAVDRDGKCQMERKSGPYCWKHETRMRRHGDVTIKKPGGYPADPANRKAAGRHPFGKKIAAKMREGKTCALCGTDQKIVVDHHHESGAFRDFLCHRCNLALGHLENRPTGWANMAMEYLQTHASGGSPVDSDETSLHPEEM